MVFTGGVVSDRINAIETHASLVGWYRELDISLRDRQVHDLICDATPAFPFGVRALVDDSSRPMIMVALSDGTITALLDGNELSWQENVFRIGSNAVWAIQCGRLFLLPARQEFFMACLAAMEFGRHAVVKQGFQNVDSTNLGNLLLKVMKSE